MESPTQFRAPHDSLGDLDAETAAATIAAAADVAVIIDQGGVVRDLAVSEDGQSAEDYGRWIGRPWADTVTVESRPKVEAMLRDATTRSPAKRRHVNHPTAHGADLPVLYSAIKLREDGKIVAVGRDLRPMAVLQQRLVDAQQALERDYLRLRHAETRYRLLFQIASEPVLILDARTRKVLEANGAADRLLAGSSASVVGQGFPRGFDAESTGLLHDMVDSARASGRSDEVHACRLDGSTEFLISASLFRQENSDYFLVRFTPLQGDTDSDVVAKSKSRLLKAIEASPDAFVVTEPDGRILACNRAFLDLGQLTSADQAVGQSIDRWLGRPGVDLKVLLGNLREHGSVRLFATVIRGEFGVPTDAEISAVSVPNAAQPCIGFVIRNVGRRLSVKPQAARELPKSVEQLTELVGRESLKDIVRETTDVIERLCIEAALELTKNNRASAAEMLGLSRQSLYTKLRRHGISDLAPDVE